MSESTTPQDLFNFAIEKYQSEDYQEAINLFRSSIELQKNWNSYQGLAWALLNTNQLGEAIDTIKKSLDLKEDWNSYQCLGTALFRIKQYTEAIYAYQNSLSLKETWNSYLDLGLALFNTEQYSAAIDSFKKSLVLKEDWYSYHILGRALLKSDLSIEAIDAFYKGINLQVNWDSYNGLGWSLLESKQFSKAIKSFQKSLVLREDISSYNGLGWALLNIQRFKEALRAFYLASDITILIPKLHEVGKQLVKGKKYDLAIEFYEELMRRHPENFLIIFGFIWTVKESKRLSEYQVFISKLKIDNCWDLVEYYELNINKKSFNFNDARSMSYVKYNFASATYVPDREKNLEEAIRSTNRNYHLVMEFGVFYGKSISFIAKILPKEKVYGFDSFEGLPEAWGTRRNKGDISTEGFIPFVPPNVQLFKGWFKDTLPKFLASKPGMNSKLIHIDCDIYSSTKTILSVLAKTIIPGTIIIFDEYYNYLGWEDHEFKAFQEFVQEYAVTYEYIAYAPNQVSIRILSKNK